MLTFKYCVLAKINRNHMTFIPKYNEYESFQNNLLQIKCHLKNEFQEITKKIEMIKEGNLVEQLFDKYIF